MPPTRNWRQALGVLDRYENVQKLKKGIEAHGLSPTGHAHKVAVETETEAYNISESREAYDAACNATVNRVPSDLAGEIPEPESPGITIGSYQNCHHIASGVVSEVYRTGVVALKVITETRNIEPHNPGREAKILSQISHDSIIKLKETSKDSEGRLILAFPFMPLTLARIVSAGTVSEDITRSCFHDLFSALSYIHEQGIIHRDVKPSNLLLASPKGPAYLADFGTSWHPKLSTTDEPADHKVLEVGTTCYRAPETLFGNRSYNTSLDMWAAGTMLAECTRTPSQPLFESRETSEDGNQLGLILSMFKTIGTPTKETWPEATKFTTPPFEWYQEFPGHSWEELLQNVDEKAVDLVAKLVCYESGRRLNAVEALEHPYLKDSRR